MGKTEIVVTPQFLISCALLLLVFPLGWILSWIFAGLIHELFHYYAIRICGGDIYRVTVMPGGAVMKTSPLCGIRKFMCCIAGPLGGLILCFFARCFPVLAICGYLQSVYNLIPIYPLDGNQALASVLTYFVTGKNAERTLNMVGNCVIVAIFLIAFVASVVLHNIIPLAIAVIVAVRNRRNTACNDGAKRLQ